MVALRRLALAANIELENKWLDRSGVSRKKNGSWDVLGVWVYSHFLKACGLLSPLLLCPFSSNAKTGAHFGGLKAEDLDFQLPLPDYEARDLRAKLKQPRAEHHLDVVGKCWNPNWLIFIGGNMRNPPTTCGGSIPLWKRSSKSIPSNPNHRALYHHQWNRWLESNIEETNHSAPMGRYTVFFQLESWYEILAWTWDPQWNTVRQPPEITSLHCSSGFFSLADNDGFGCLGLKFGAVRGFQGDDAFMTAISELG